MPSGVRRVSLPSGGWWEILTRPLWSHLREWTACQAEQPTPRLVDRALLSLTSAWSFAEELTLEAVSSRDIADLIAVLEALQAEAWPLEDAVESQDLAEDLFAGLAIGRVPPRFADVHLMAATGWSWQTLQSTPADVVRKMAIYLSVTQARNTASSLEFTE